MDLKQPLKFSPGDADRLDVIATRLENAAPQEILRWAFDQFADGVAIATGFGAEGVAMIDMAVKINPHPNIFFIDTDFLFPETYELRRRIEDRYGIEIRAVRPELTPQSQERGFGPRLWSRDADLCCRIRKLEPLKVALDGLNAWMTAIRRDQTLARSTARVVEWDYLWQIVKVNPLARWTRREVWGYVVKNRVPYNPLHDEGYPSLGCTHCTRRTVEGEHERAGRWAGHQKTECGLHAATQAAISSNSFEV
jgi:phosphoadenosine phosphosulfate reductase